MKQRELQPCLMCEQGVCHRNQTSFFRISITHMVVNSAAVERQIRLEMMMGSPPINNLLGLDEDMATELEEVDGLICLECAMKCEVAQVFESQN